jgi:hypothetical protein
MPKPGKQHRRRVVGGTVVAVAAVGAVVAAALAVSGGDATPADTTTVADGVVGTATSAPENAGVAATDTSGAVVPATPASTTPAPRTEVTEPPAGVPAATDAEPVTAGGTVDVVVSWSGWVDDQTGVEVDGFVVGVVESGGTCTLTLTRGETSLSATSAAEPDASTTLCAPLYLAGADVAAGSWDAVLSYTSASSTGVSAPAVVAVPAR